MKRAMPAWSRVGFISLTFAILVVSFQNCSSGFEAGVIQSTSGLPSRDAGGGDFQDQTAIQRFSAAKSVIDGKCVSCHTGGGTMNLRLATEQEFIAANLISPGDLANSRLIYRLSHYPIKNGAQNMPPSGNTQLTTAEYSILTNWVSSLKSAGNQRVNPFSCAANENPAGLDARRLTKLQVQNSIRDLFSRALGAADAQALLTAANVGGRLPNDAAAPFTSADNAFSVLHARALFDIADSIATGAVSANNYSRFVTTFVNYNRGSCALSDVNNLSLACREALTRNFLLRAWGRPVDSTTANMNNEFAAFMESFNAASSSRVGVEGLVYRAILSPEFIFHLQIDVQAENGAHRLSSHLIARRLAFLFTQTLPDETLLTMAEQGDLMSEAAFANAIDHVAQRMAPTVDTFTREWLGFSRFPNYRDLTHPKFQLVSQGMTTDDVLRTAMMDEAVELVQYVNRNQRPIGELFTSNISFARNQSLMRIYGQANPAPSNVTESNAVRFPAGERSGLLTRAALLFSGTHTENPVLRSVHVRKQIFCRSVASPPPELNDQTNVPDLDGTQTTRERYHVKTSPSACVGCHSQINPVGFVFSKYNALGALQAQEPIFSSGNPPSLITYLPTDSSANLQVALGINQNVSDAVEMSTLVADSSDFKRCFSMNLEAYVQGASTLPTTTNSCSMNRIYQTMDGPNTLQDVFKSIARDPRFRYRTISR